MVSYVEYAKTSRAAARRGVRLGTVAGPDPLFPCDDLKPREQSAHRKSPYLEFGGKNGLNYPKMRTIPIWDKRNVAQ